MDVTLDWTFHQVSGFATIWFPALEWAYQLMDAAVNTWEENPWNTEAFFVVPRVFHCSWGRASKHIVEVTVTPCVVDKRSSSHPALPFALSYFLLCRMVACPCLMITLFEDHASLSHTGSIAALVNLTLLCM
jgi:hypothetical protein